MHAFIEFDSDSTDELFPEGGYALPFNQGPFHSCKNLRLFDALAEGCRPFYDEEDWNKNALYPPRGLPKNVSLTVATQFAHRVVLKGDIVKYNKSISPGLYAVDLQEAETWVSNGESEFINYKTSEFSNLVTFEGRYVASPFYKNSSWLYLNEIYESLEHHGIQLDKLDENDREMFPAILELMKSLEKKLGKGRTRLVFWFSI